MRCLNSGCVDYTETRNSYCGRYADVTECDEMEPRNLAKPNAQPALSEVLAKIATKSENSIEFSDSEGEFCKVISVSDVEKILSEYFA